VARQVLRQMKPRPTMNEAYFFIGSEVFAVELSSEITLRLQDGFTSIWRFHLRSCRRKKNKPVNR